MHHLACVYCLHGSVEDQAAGGGVQILYIMSLYVSGTVLPEAQIMLELQRNEMIDFFLIFSPVVNTQYEMLMKVKLNMY